MTYRDAATTRILVASATLLFLSMCAEAALSTWMAYRGVEAEIRFVVSAFDLRSYERMFAQISRDGLRSLVLAHVMSFVLLGTCFAGLALSHSRRPATWKAGSLFLAFLLLPVGEVSTWMVEAFVDLGQGSGAYASATWSPVMRRIFDSPVYGPVFVTMTLAGSVVEEVLPAFGIGVGTSFDDILERDVSIYRFHAWLFKANTVVILLVSILLAAWSIRLAWVGRTRRRRGEGLPG